MHIQRRLRIVALALMLLFSISPLYAQQTNFFLPLDCNKLFSLTSQGGYGFVTQSFVSSQNASLAMLEVAIVIILLVLTAYGVVYAVGLAFHIDRLKQFTRSEMVESTLNLVAVVIIVGGIGVIAAGIGFMANLGGLFTNLPLTQITSPQSLYITVCNQYMNNVVNPDVNGVITTLLQTYVYSAIMSTTIELQPNGFGFTYKPFNGLYPAIQVLFLEFDVLAALAGIGLIVIIFLYAIFWLFPLLLYAGIALRSFPWTRPAGGAMIAVFISFYAIFPALLYPFAAISFCNTNNGGISICTLCGPNGLLSQPQYRFFNQPPYNLACSAPSVATFFSTVAQILGLIAFNEMGPLISANVYLFAINVASSSFEIIGIIISLLISYDLVEKLGDMIGAPSLAGGRQGRVLTKII